MGFHRQALNTHEVLSGEQIDLLNSWLPWGRPSGFVLYFVSFERASTREYRPVSVTFCDQGNDVQTKDREHLERLLTRAVKFVRHNNRVPRHLLA